MFEMTPVRRKGDSVNLANDQVQMPWEVLDRKTKIKLHGSGGEARHRQQKFCDPEPGVSDRICVF